MRDALWIAKKNEMCSLLKQLSDMLGGDDREWLREYAKYLIKNDTGNFSETISFLRNSLYGIKIKSNSELKIKNKDIKCNQCGYVPPFCFYYYNEKCIFDKNKCNF